MTTTNLHTNTSIPTDGSELGPEIRDLVFRYVALPTVTGSPGERLAEDFFLDAFQSHPYFRAHPEDLGLHPTSAGPDAPKVCYALVRGQSPRTVVLIHHYDVVTTEDYKTLQQEAYDPDALEAALRQIRETLGPEAREDLDSGAWLFGHGACDMKGGGAIQMALLREYGDHPENLPGNLLLLGVPDEENLSAGMLAAVGLLDHLKKTSGLEYRMMINSEPHQRHENGAVLLSEGSVGKLMPFVYVRGSLSHAGKVFEGLNPLGILSAVVRKTELSMDFSETKDQEASPPPTWLYLKDGKNRYDVSMPLSAAGCFSVLTLGQGPAQILPLVRRVCEDAVEETLEAMGQSYARFLSAKGFPPAGLPWEVRVQPAKALFEEALADGGDACRAALDQSARELAAQLAGGGTDYIQATFALIETAYGYVRDLSPRVIYGLVPPYYPGVCNRDFPGLDPDRKELGKRLLEYLASQYGGRGELESYFTGISDLSYSSLRDSGPLGDLLEGAMPLFHRLYDLPLPLIESIAMPCINIGPWGKDFHKLTERVYKEDLYEITPALLREAIRILLAE